jgi:hypothetical protein
MNNPVSPPKLAGKSALREIRYSLNELLLDVADERLTGAFGAEKLRQSDINKVFNGKTGNNRRPRS